MIKVSRGGKEGGIPKPRVCIGNVLAIVQSDLVSKKVEEKE